MGKRKPERTDFLANVLVTAVEGGSNYWAEFSDYKWREDIIRRNMTDASVTCTVLDNRGYPDPKQVHKVTLNTIAKGIKVCKGLKLNQTIKASILLADADPENADIDGDAADCILQAALFGEIVFG